MNNFNRFHDMFVGIDPGSKGAIAILDSTGNPVLLEDMPFVKEDKCLDLLKLKSFFNDFSNSRIHCVLEKCQYTPAIKGSGAFTFGKTIGYTEAFLICNQISHELIRPQIWKKEFGLINKEKTSSIEVAKRMFPTVSDRLKKTKDGLAEALLIAEYCRRKCCSKNG